MAKTTKPTKIAKKKAPAKPKKVVKARVKKVLPPQVNMESPVLDRLWSTVMSRREVDPSVSHSARLLSRGVAKVAQKFGEEAVECLIEAVAGNKPALIAESADVLYHLMVMWVDSGVSPDEVWAELVRREGVSGIAEKAARTAPGTSKIP